MHNNLDGMDELSDRIHAIAPMGYSLLVNIREFTPEYYDTTYPPDWVRIYHERRYALFDPATIWFRFNVGVIRWSEIKISAAQNATEMVMKHAARFDLRYGGCAAATSEGDQSVKSLLFGAREDREMTDGELTELGAILDAAVGKIRPNLGLSEAELGALRDLASGLTHNEIADLRGVSPATIKKRIERAREVLGAKNAVQAVAIATRRGLIWQDPFSRAQ